MTVKIVKEIDEKQEKLIKRHSKIVNSPDFEKLPTITHYKEAKFFYDRYEEKKKEMEILKKDYDEYLDILDGMLAQDCASEYKGELIIDNRCMCDYECASRYLEKKGILIKINDRLYRFADKNRRKIMIFDDKKGKWVEKKQSKKLKQFFEKLIKKEK